MEDITDDNHLDKKCELLGGWESALPGSVEDGISEQRKRKLQVILSFYYRKNLHINLWWFSDRQTAALDEKRSSLQSELDKGGNWAMTGCNKDILYCVSLVEDDGT